MKFTKQEHSGFSLELETGCQLLCDPVEFEATLPNYNNVSVIVITHKHSDHCQPQVLSKILQANPKAQIFTTGDTAPLLEDLGANVDIVKAGDTRSVDGFELSFFGQNHAAIIPGVVPCENIGFTVGSLTNPGDSFDLPPKTTSFLLVPSAAPWCKVCESSDYIKSAHPTVAAPIHDAVLSDLGKSIHNNWLKSACDEQGITYHPLIPGESLSI